jgi:hypothetical protein
MTNLVDFDRSLTDFLADGPNSAPEAPLIAVLAHARTTPRRPDPFARLRPDVMSRRTVVGLGRRPVLLLAALGLVLAAVGVAVIGARPADPSIVTPNPSTGPGPSAAPTPAPAASVATFRKELPILLTAGQPLVVSVSDATGDLVDAVSLQPGDGASVDFGTVEIQPDATDLTTFLVVWTGQPCETTGALLVDEGTSRVTITRQDCSGDGIALDRIVRLRFRTPPAVAAWSGALSAPAGSPAPVGSPTTAGQPEPLGSPSVTPIHLALDDGVGGPTAMDIVDESGILASAEAGPQTPGNGFDRVDATNDTPTTVRLTWPGRPCDTVHRLTIDAALTTLTIDAPHCAGDLLGVDRAVLLTFSRPVDAPSLNTGISLGRGGVDMPNWTTTAPDSGNGQYDLTLLDPGYAVDSIDGFFDPETTVDVLAGSTIRVLATSFDPATLRLVWLGPDCATSYALTIAADRTHWRLTGPGCAPHGADVLRMIDVTLAVPRAPDAITAESIVTP